MENVSQILLRNRALLSGAGQANAGTLLFNPPRDGLYADLQRDLPALLIHTQDYGDYAWFAAQELPATFGLLPDEASPLSSEVSGPESGAVTGAAPGAVTGTVRRDQVILFLPREKERLEMLLHYLADTMAPNASLWLVGENRAGIKSAGKRLEKYFAEVTRVDNARHCSLLRARPPAPPAPFRLDDYREQWTLGEGDQALKLVSLPGAFAHGRLDKGTAFLLDYLAERPPLTGQVLDFGCGTGVIGLTLLQRSPELELTLVDSAAAALESARLSLAANGLEATILASDGLDDVAGRFDWIISNPPFHRGVQADTSTTERFIMATGRRLKAGGRLLIVCNRHLPYEGWLASCFDAIENRAASHEFKILMAQRPTAARRGSRR